MKKYFVTAIGTDSGKTLVSAILTEALQADYWKPIQCGLEFRDTDTVKSLVSNGFSFFHPEAYLFKTPASPHAAALLENKKIDLEKVLLPETEDNNLIIEGAGGILVPLNEKAVIIDIAEKFGAEVILVSNLYLGSINHTLLSIEELKRRKLQVKGIIFNGEPNPASEDIILKKSGYKCLLKIIPEKEITPDIISKYAIKLFEHWDE